jgi:CheY-like chemotaxis protein
MANEKTLLMIDDSRVSRMVTISHLKEREIDWQVTEASSADEAIEIVKNQSFDFITVDFNMPGMTGGDFLLQKQTLFPNTKCVLLTANVQQDEFIKTNNIDAKCLFKPICDRLIEELIEYFDE